jgi:hypothetical protein
MAKKREGAKDTKNKTQKRIDDLALLNEAIVQATTEATQLQEADARRCAAAAVALAAARAAEAEVHDDDDEILPEDVPVFTELPGACELPAAVRAEPSLVHALKTVDPAATSKASGVSAIPVDFSRETPRERELRLREVKNKLKARHQIERIKRGGKRAVENTSFREPASFIGDERADEIATRPPLIAAYIRRFAEWLLEGARATRLLDAPETPDHFALLFRFDLSKDPVVRCARSLLGSQIDVLLVGFNHVVHYIASDYADGLFAAVKAKALDPVLSPTNVLAVLPRGTKPTGLGVRMTGLEQLALMPHLSAHAYPHGIPAALVHDKRPWGTDLGAESAADRLARAMATQSHDADDDEAFDDSDNEDGTQGGKTVDASDDPVTRMVYAELRSLGRTRFPVSRAILDAFKPDAAGST